MSVKKPDNLMIGYIKSWCPSRAPKSFQTTEIIPLPLAANKNAIFCSFKSQKAAAIDHPRPLRNFADLGLHNVIFRKLAVLCKQI